MNLKKRRKGFFLAECLIGITLLAILAAFVIPAFHNIWVNMVQADQELMLLFHAQNITEDLMALYHVSTSSVPSLLYHNLDLTTLLEQLRLSSEGDRISQFLIVDEKNISFEVEILQKNVDIIRCRSDLRYDFMTEGLQLEFMLSPIGG